MPLNHHSTRSGLIAIALASLSMAAQAHTGHETEGVVAGLIHPFGPDHLLAMLAVGVWSVASLPKNQAWQGPSTFLLALIAGAVFGFSGVVPPFLETGISLSVVLFGVMLVLTVKPVPKPLGLGLIASAAALHGLAHGAETPDSGFAVYAIGFLLTTAALHMSGVGIGLSIQRWMAERRHLALRGLGTAVGVAGLYLFSRV